MCRGGRWEVPRVYRHRPQMRTARNCMSPPAVLGRRGPGGAQEFPRIPICRVPLEGKGNNPSRGVHIECGAHPPPPEAILRSRIAKSIRAKSVLISKWRGGGRRRGIFAIDNLYYIFGGELFNGTRAILGKSKNSKYALSNGVSFDIPFVKTHYNFNGAKSAK